MQTYPKRTSCPPIYCIHRYSTKKRKIHIFQLTINKSHQTNHETNKSPLARSFFAKSWRFFIEKNPKMVYWCLLLYPRSLIYSSWKDTLWLRGRKESSSNHPIFRSADMVIRFRGQLRHKTRKEWVSEWHSFKATACQPLKNGRNGKTFQFWWGIAVQFFRGVFLVVSFMMRTLFSPLLSLESRFWLSENPKKIQVRPILKVFSSTGLYKLVPKKTPVISVKFHSTKKPQWNKPMVFKRPFFSWLYITPSEVSKTLGLCWAPPFKKVTWATKETLLLSIESWLVYDGILILAYKNPYILGSIIQPTKVFSLLTSISTGSTVPSPNHPSCSVVLVLGPPPGAANTFERSRGPTWL